MKLLIKEIKSKAGELHFRRWRLLELPFFAIYIHGIYKSDEDLHPHSHPWSFVSFILKGSYEEELHTENLMYHGIEIKPYFDNKTFLRKTYSVVGHTTKSFHKLKIINGPVYTLVFTFGFKKDWGYLVEDKFVKYTRYREFKNTNVL